MQPLLADVRRGLQRQGEGDSGLLCLKVGRVVGEHAATARLLPEFTGKEIVVVDLTPERSCHIKSILCMPDFDDK